MKVALDARAAGGELTGIGNYLVHLSQGLKKRGIDVLLIYDGIPLYKIKGIKRKIIPGKNRFNWEQVEIVNFLRGAEIDIYHATWNYGIPITYGGKTVLTVHDIIPIVWKKYFLNRKKNFLSRRVLDVPSYLLSLSISLIKSNRIIVDSVSTSNDLQKIYPFTKNKTRVVSLGMDLIKKPSPNYVAEIKKKYKLAKPYLIYIGGVDKRKNIDGVIHAFSKSTLLTTHQLVIVGPHSDFYKSFAEKFGVNSSTSFIGYVSEDEKFGLLRGAIALVYPSYYEGFGLPVLEAMSVGTPVITSDRSSLPEVAGDAAILVNPSDVNQLSRAMMDISFNPDLRKKLSSRGLIQVKKFSWDKTVADTIEVYKKVLADD